ncbi:BRCA1-A complex subunit Abraxas 1 isoform X2 [Echeneis naucrates]|uniref:BRCA1-A complex subunit Abraxas 1 isoform X2 n=1 Tax=Echeneis naucrates TaxID=173247 RepID=UPI00111390FF|nr:BRCA1-A complex subunit Abraxas 1 isoform X2 [Echeneis naucrates]
MMAAPTVRVSGIVLSSLMFQHVNGDGDVEGLVLGESKFEEQVTISDSQADHIHIEETYNIQKHIACHKLNTFYNSVGDIDMEAVRKLLVNNEQERVIGWYRQRRNTDQVMSFREKVVHENLKTSLSNPHMIFVLLTPSKLTPPGSTHKMEYAAFISRSRHFINVPILVNNLGVLEQLAYWKVSASCSATGYNLTMKKHGSKFFSSNGLLREVNEVNDMNESLQAELQKACRDVEESERRLETLQSYVSALRIRLREKRRSLAGKELEKDLPEQKNNLLLQDAVRTLFARSPLFQTQILTLQAFPVPHVHCGSEQDDAVSVTPQDSQSPLNATRTNGWKRQKETSEGKDRKRRKNQL